MEMKRLDTNSIHVGICFSEPVFFDDGKNMFLAAGRKAKPYQVAALTRWKIPYLLTNGVEIDPSEYKPPVEKTLEKDISLNEDSFDNVEELEDL